MPDNSAILALPYIQPSQAQKHVTHNEALAALDVLVQLSVTGFGLTTPLVAPTEGDTCALGAGPTGVWAGQDNQLATWRDGIWRFITPLAGWRAWGVAEAELRIWDGSAWGLPTAGTQNLDGVGIGTTSDATNRLSVKADATLLSHDGDDHQLKINKAGSGDTASVLFQSNWTGHAEMGLNGDTDFAIKVSANGSSWTGALSFDGASGLASGAAIQSSTSDATAGRLMKVGAFGLGGSAITLTSGDDLDSLTRTGFYYNPTGGNTPGNNYPISSAGSLLNIRRSSSNWTQTFITYAGSSVPGMYLRSYGSSGWSSWHRVMAPDSDGNLSVGGNMIGWQSMTIADDAVGVFTMPRNGGFVTITCNGNNNYPSQGHSGMLYCDAGTSLAIEKNTGWASAGTSLDAVTTNLTGTTGTDGRTTVAVQTGVLKIENRSGGAKTYEISFC